MLKLQNSWLDKVGLFLQQLPPTFDCTVKDAAPGRSVIPTRGTKINFGKAEGEIR
ncbi:hypothetical protein [Dendronalium sp. ChiSLP03b]|uniref:hypothetical protein n=1 Tax=Dendronalium sp. ChiSLP03b TaxID=3075381 RepID=UPI002AD31EA5|nr:hypothetical protein [Dendronalium sp. ChiSLP03b]MDZ8205949.1 hypothetical protein [Dendronalium sp. ChiSLP03b]